MLKDKKNIWVVVAVVGIILCFAAMPSLQNKSVKQITPTEESTPSSSPPSQLIPPPAEEELQNQEVYTNSFCLIISFGRGGDINPHGVSRFLKEGTWNYTGITWTFNPVEGKSWKVQGQHSGELKTFVGKYRSHRLLRERGIGFIIGFATYVECKAY